MKVEVNIPDEMTPFAADLQYFWETMARKLHTNRHKGFGKGQSLDALMSGMRGEVDELSQALDKESQFAASIEAVDVANFGFITASALWHATRPDYEEQRADRNGNWIDKAVAGRRLDGGVDFGRETP